MNKSIFKFVLTEKERENYISTNNILISHVKHSLENFSTNGTFLFLSMRK